MKPSWDEIVRGAWVSIGCRTFSSAGRSSRKPPLYCVWRMGFCRAAGSSAKIKPLTNISVTARGTLRRTLYYTMARRQVLAMRALTPLYAWGFLGIAAVPLAAIVVKSAPPMSERRVALTKEYCLRHYGRDSAVIAQP